MAEEMKESVVLAICLMKEGGKACEITEVTEVFILQLFCVKENVAEG